MMIIRSTRYPVVESIPSTNFKVTRQRLKKIYATYGTPSQILTDYGPPFNNREFGHHSLIPLHPTANGEAEEFIHLVNTAEQISASQGLGALARDISVQEMLTAYRPHA